jgi:hypothetical protein
MQEAGFRERRSCPRFYARIAVLCVNPATSIVYLAMTHELSAHGIRIISTEPIQPSSLLNICINMPDNGEQINVRGQVVWSQQVNDDHFMIGIHLKNCALKPVPIALRSIQANL